MADGKIYITISDNRLSGGDANGGGNGGGSATTDKEKDKLKNSIFKGTMAVGSALVANAMKYVNYSLSNIGNFTGDYTKQQSSEASVQAFSTIVGIGASIVAGAKYGGVVGGVAAGIISLGSTAVSHALSDHSHQVAYNKEMYDINQLREISGMNVLTNGSRI